MFDDYIYYAHRGLHNNRNIIENTLEAFENAIMYNFAIELDVQLTKDNYIVVFHDYNLKRLTNVDKEVKDCTLSEIQGLKLMETSAKIPTIEETLKLVNGSVPLMIEIKNEKLYSQINKLLNRRLKEYRGKYMISSFNPLSLLWYRLNAKNVTRGQLVTCHYDKGAVLNYLLTNMAFNSFVKPNFIACDKDCLSIMQKQREKYEVAIWTLKNKEELEQYRALGDAYIFEGFIPK